MKVKNTVIVFLAVSFLFVDLFGSLYFIQGVSPLMIFGIEKKQKNLSSQYNFQKKPWWLNPKILKSIEEPDTLQINGILSFADQNSLLIKTENGDTTKIVPVKAIRLYKLSANIDLNDINHDNSQVQPSDFNLLKKDLPAVVNAVMENNILLGVSAWIE